MYLNQTSPTRSNMRAMLGSRDQTYGRDTGNRAPSYDGYRNTDHTYNNSNMALPSSSPLPQDQSRFKPSSFNEPLNFNYDAYLKKDYMNQSEHIPGGSSTGWAGAATSAASYRTGGGLGRSSGEARGGRYDAVNYSKQDYLQYQIGSGLVPQQNYNQMMMDDSRYNDQIGSTANNKLNTSSATRPTYGGYGQQPSTADAGRYGVGMQGGRHETVNDGRYSPLGNFDSSSNNQSMVVYPKQNSSSYLGGGQQPQSATIGRRYPLDSSMDNHQYSRAANYDSRLPESSFGLTSTGNGHLQRDNALLDQRLGSSFNKYNTPKRRTNSYVDTKETEQRAGLGGLGGMDLQNNSRYMRSPQFGQQRSSRTAENDQMYARGTTQRYPSYQANASQKQWGVGQGFGSGVKPGQAASIIQGRGSYQDASGYGGQTSAATSQWGANRYNEAYDHLKHSRPSEQYKPTQNGLYMSYFQKPLSSSQDASRKYLGGKSLNQEQSPFSREQLEQYRTQASHKTQYASNETKFTPEHYRVYADILDRLPTSKFESGKNVLTDNEKRYIKDEMDRIQRGNQVQMLDGSGDTSISMIHMIFHFFLQSAEYSFFINRIKNIAQSKMKGSSNISPNQQSFYGNVKPLKSSAKNLLNLSQQNRSDASLLTKSVQYNAVVAEVYIETDESMHANPALGEEIYPGNNEAKTKRSRLDQISYDGLAVQQKKNSDPEPRNGEAITELPYRQELSKSVPPQTIAEELKAVQDPSSMTQASTAISGDQTQNSLHQKKQGSVVTEEMIHQNKTEAPEVSVDKKNLSPGRLARPLKTKKYQQSQIYSQSPEGEKPAEPAMSTQPPMEKPRDRSHEPIDNQFLIDNQYDIQRNQVKSAQHTTSNERPYTLNQRTAYRYNGRGAEPAPPINNLTDFQTKSIYNNADSMTNNRYTSGVGGYTSAYNNNDYSRLKGTTTTDYLNTTQHSDLNALNHSANQSRDNIYDRSSNQNYRSFNTHKPSYSKPTDVNTGLNPYMDNRSPSPKSKRVSDLGLDNGPISFNTFLDKSEPVPRPISEPDSALSDVLKEQNDDFRLTIHKMSTADQQAAPRAAAAAPRASAIAPRASAAPLTTTTAGYSKSSYNTPLSSSSYNMLGKGGNTSNTDYTSQVLQRALAQRTSGMPQYQNSMNRSYYRY